MWVRGDGRLVLVRTCGLWHQGFAKEGVGDIDKDVSYNNVFNSLLFDKNANGWEILYRHSLPVLYLRYAIDSRKLSKELGWEPSL